MTDFNRGSGIGGITLLEAAQSGGVEKGRSAALVRRRDGRRALVTVSFIILATILIASISGCGGNKAITDYTEQVDEAISDLDAKAKELKKLWSVPISDQAGMQDVLTDYRKALARAQEIIDSADPPSQCLELESLLRKSVSNGRELADLMSPFAEYTARVGPIMARIGEVVAALETLQEDNDVPSGLAGLTSKIEQAGSDLAARVPPLLFQGMNDELREFTASLVAAFQKASKELGTDPDRYRQDQPEDEDEVEPSDDEQEQESRRVEPLLEDVPEEWAEFSAEFVALMDVALQVAGVKAKDAEVEGYVSQAFEQIEKLKKQYK